MGDRNRYPRSSVGLAAEAVYMGGLDGPACRTMGKTKDSAQLISNTRGDFFTTRINTHLWRTPLVGTTSAQRRAHLQSGKPFPDEHVTARSTLQELVVKHISFRQRHQRGMETPAHEKTPSFRARRLLLL